MEVLAANLAAHLMEDPPHPMEPERIVVQSRGMERWLSMEIAKWTGIAAHLDFLFPASLMTELLCPAWGLLRDEDPWKPQVLRWACHEILPLLSPGPDVDAVREYMGEDVLRRFQLADMLADLLDQYLMFRPDLILAWERGEGTHFQAQLWRMLRARIGTPHRLGLLREFTGQEGCLKLPARISIFGVSALPPLYLSFLEKLSESVDIRWYLLDPCEEYWGDIRCQGFWEVQLAEACALGWDGADLHVEKGHPLLASLGRTGQDFFRRLAEMGGHENRHAQDPGMDTRLHRLQSRILSLYPSAEGVLDESLGGGSEDSIVIHRCHGPMRELEVLRDQLLRLFSGEHAPKPKDILVMFPDVGAYAPYIDGVFGRPLPNGRRLPYTISERPKAMENTLAGLLMRVLLLMDSRFGASEVFDLLESDPVARRLGLDEGALDRIRSWLVDTRIRWGLDAAFKEALDLPPLGAHTWRFGLDRMILGMAMEDEGGAPEKGGILPYDPMGPDAVEPLNGLLDFMETLMAFHRAIREDRDAQGWMELLWDLIGRLFDERQEDSEDFLFLRSMLDALVRDTRLAGLGEKIPFKLIQAVLGEELQRAGEGGLILSGGITFCAMVPMRCIPFSVICLCGMNDGAFPRTRPRPAFDLITQSPRPGDRSSRDDDRYLFLETLLSAREKLWITYTGFRPEDGKPLPPSVLVQELVDALHGDEGPVLPGLIQAYPLQAFSATLFTTEDPAPGVLFSYSSVFRDVARAFSVQGEKEGPVFQDGALEGQDAEHRVALDDFLAFFQDPSAFFLGRSMQIRMEREGDALEDRENFSLDGLGSYTLQAAFCRAALEAMDERQALARLEAQGLLPMGAWGRTRVAELAERGRALAAAFIETPGETGGEMRPFTLELKGLRLEGSLPECHRPEGEKIWRAGSLRERHLLGGWLRFLVRQALGLSLSLSLVGMGKEGVERCHFSGSLVSRQRALEYLEQLMGLYRAGLRKPLPLFPPLSKIWAEDVLGKKPNPEKTMETLRRNWDSGEKSYLLGPGKAALLLWRGKDPFEAPFAETAETLWLPLLTALGEEGA
jgi:exodeoxyribonuclease V gamma subunit